MAVSLANEDSGNSGQGGPAPPRRTFASILWSLCKLGMLAGILTACAAATTIWFGIKKYETGLPSAEALRTSYRPAQVTRVLARDGTVLAQIFTERRTVIGFNTIPPHTKLCFLAAEDARFYEHEGLNYVGMLRAIVKNVRAGRTVQGGSTITQQVVKNLWLSPDRTFVRKIQETILARRLEQSLSKDEILGLYLNHIYLGHGRYGVEEAARYYFGKHATELDLSESATLAGLVAAPERFSPRRDMNRAIERRRFVLGQMQAKGFAGSEAVAQALSTPIRMAPAAEEESDLAPEAVAYALHLLQTVEGESANRGGYTIHTTIDPKLELAARRALRENLDGYLKRLQREPPFSTKSRRLAWGPLANGHPKRFHMYVGKVTEVDDAAGTIKLLVGDVVGVLKLARDYRFNPKHLKPSHFAEVGALLRVQVTGDPDTESPELQLDLGPQSALVAIDVRSRHVIALVGSYEAVSGGLDRATQAHRQPGSAFKAFVYSYAIHLRRFTAATLLELPADVKHGATEPRHLRVREALAKSDNYAAEKLLEATGAGGVVEWARASGIESPLAPTPSLALGAYEVTPLELTNAYSTFASGGVYAPAVLVTSIEGPGGTVVSLPELPASRQVMSSSEAFITTSLLRSVVESGTAVRARRLGRPVAGKTGTTNASRDAWFVGYSPDIVAGVWVGYDDGLTLGSTEAGATAALPAWIEFMKQAQEGRPVVDFPRPAELEVERIDPESGRLAYEGQTNALEEIFLPGTTPTERAEVPDAGSPSNDRGNAGAASGESAATNGQKEPGAPDEQPTPAR